MSIRDKFKYGDIVKTNNHILMVDYFDDRSGTMFCYAQLAYNLKDNTILTYDGVPMDGMRFATKNEKETLAQVASIIGLTIIY